MVFIIRGDNTCLRMRLHQFSACIKLTCHNRLTTTIETLFPKARCWSSADFSFYYSLTCAHELQKDSLMMWDGAHGSPGATAQFSTEAALCCSYIRFGEVYTPVRLVFHSVTFAKLNAFDPVRKLQKEKACSCAQFRRFSNIGSAWEPFHVLTLAGLS